MPINIIQCIHCINVAKLSMYGQTYLYISLGFRYIGIRGNVEHPRGKGGRIVSPDVTDLVEKHTAAA